MALPPIIERVYKTPDGTVVDTFEPRHESQFRGAQGKVGQVVVELKGPDGEDHTVIWDRVPADWELVSTTEEESATVDDNEVPDAMLENVLDNLDTGSGGFYTFYFEGEELSARGKPKAIELLRQIPVDRLDEVTTEAPEAPEEPEGDGGDDE